MTQERHMEHKDVISSFDVDKTRLAFGNAGPYRGFDTLASIVGLTFSISHAGNGLQYLKSDGSGLSNLTGFLLSRQGIIIMEDAAIGPFTVDTNAANTHDRIDIIICEHQYDDSVTGGNAATYSVVKGSTSSTVQPAIPDPTTQVLVGILTIPAGASSVLAGYYKRAESIGLGGKDFARRDYTNAFLGLQKWNKGNDQDIAVNGIVDIDESGNLFKVTDSSPIGYLQGIKKPSQDGTIIALFLEAGVTMRGHIAGVNSLSGANITAGYRKIVLPLNDPASDYTYLTQNETLVLFMYFNNLWYPISDFQSTMKAVWDQLACCIEHTTAITELLAPPSWTAFSALDDVVLDNVSAYVPAHSLKNGRVQVRGAVMAASPTPTYPLHVDDLPVGSRPNKVVHFICPTATSFAIVEVDTAGHINILSVGSGPAEGIDMSQVFFYVN